MRTDASRSPIPRAPRRRPAGFQRPGPGSGGLAALLLALLAASVGSTAPIASGAPIPVVHTISIRNGDWIPLPVEDMRRAAGDAALSRLSDAGRLHLIGTRTDSASAGSLALEIALIGPAETAKLTITLDVRDSPTLVSTASISVRGLDHAGIYDALEHVGTRAADRLAAKLDFLHSTGEGGRIRRNAPSDDPARRRVYDEAQAAKRAGRYEEARNAFEAIVESASTVQDTLRRLAEDELRYGLPLFEAQQALNQLGRLGLPGQQSRREAALSRAENLFRQIQAENPSHVERVLEAQRALDNLIVVRGALANSMRASLLSRMQALRIAMIEFSMSEGRCPDRAWIDEMVSRVRARVTLDEVHADGDRATRYVFSEATSRTRVALRCTDDGIEIVETGDEAPGVPAAFPASLR